MEDRKITAREMIEYLQTFPEDSDVSIIVVDVHQEKKIGFMNKEIFLITDTDNAAVLINIDRNETTDITKN